MRINFHTISSSGHMLCCCSVEVSKVIVEETKLFNITVSFGSVSSLMTLPCYMSHASIPAEVRVARGLPDDLVRISAGVEDIDDLLAGVLSPPLPPHIHCPHTPHPPYSLSTAYEGLVQVRPDLHLLRSSDH